jgi:hypothetical protein
MSFKAIGRQMGYKAQRCRKGCFPFYVCGAFIVYPRLFLMNIVALGKYLSEGNCITLYNACNITYTYTGITIFDIIRTKKRGNFKL